MEVPVDLDLDVDLDLAKEVAGIQSEVEARAAHLIQHLECQEEGHMVR